MKKYFFAIILILCHQSNAQEKKYIPLIVAFYNVENLYDTINNSAVNDEEFLLEGSHNYNGNVYKTKLNNIASVLQDVGTAQQQKGFSFIGLAEVENDTVLNDLISHEILKDRHLQFVHFDSKDARGVDVAFVYNPVLFKVEQAYPIFVKLPAGTKQASFTRDILYVKGKLLEETIHVFVNHWSSRYGGQAKSNPARIQAATILKQNMDRIRAYDTTAKIIVMGDLNDDPTDKSIYKTLGAVEQSKLTKDNYLFNPWIEKFKSGRGTLAFQNTWGLFDQIILNDNFISTNNRLYYKNATIFRPDYLVDPSGNFKGYPLRTFNGNNFQFGYSDHFPVFITLMYRITQ